MTGNSIRITEFLVFCLPLIEAAVGLASISGLVVRLFRTNVGHRWLRISTPSMLRNTRFEPGFLGRDYTLVSVGRKWCLARRSVSIRRAQRLDKHAGVLAGESSPDDPIQPERNWRSARM